ncbi:MAG: hypothetical protein IJU84_02530 [Clostridia bacterium]|nr:hypothetical protein [Clostridia bacterium]
MLLATPPYSTTSPSDLPSRIKKEASIKGSNGKLDYADQAPYWNGHPLWNEHKTASGLLTEQIRKLGY